MRKWPVCILAATPLLAGAQEREAEERPNILFIMAEDISNDLACYGIRGVRTPHLDRLAEEGMRFTRFYTTSPICSPSRTALMTGIYQTAIGGHHHRDREAIPPEQVVPLTHLLRDAGYLTILGSDQVLDKGLKIDVNIDFRNGRRALFDVTAYDDLRALRRRPFFQQVQMKSTHRDAGAPRWAETRAASAHPVDPDAVEVPPYLPDIPEVRYDIANYLDMIEYMDAEVGRLLAELKEDGHFENTIIVFIGDNGRNQIRGKSYLWEAGILCPLIIRGPGIEPGGVNHDLISGIDLTVQMLAWAGATPPPAMQGRAFLGCNDYTPRSAVFAARDRHDEVMDCSRAIVTERYKYIVNFMPEVPWDARIRYYENPRVRPLLPVLRDMNEKGLLTPGQAVFFLPRKPEEQLYDLATDPWELLNVADDPDYLEIRQALRAELFHWMEETGDQGLIQLENGTWMPSAMSP